MTGSRLLLLQAGAQLPLQPPAVPWNPKSSCLSPEKGAQEKSWKLGTAAKDDRKFQEAGRSEQGMEGAGTSPGFFPCHFSKSQKKVRNLQVKHSGNSSNYRCLNSTALHRNKRKIRQVLLKL